MGTPIELLRLTQRLDEGALQEIQRHGAGPKTMEALRRLSRESAALEIASPGSLLSPPTADEITDALDDVRDNALDYTMNLPNYICTQVIRRRQEQLKGRHLAHEDLVQEQLTFFDYQETYKVIMVDGKPADNVAIGRLGGFVTSGEFGTLLGNIFTPDAGVELTWDHWASLRQKRTYVFAYKVPADIGEEIGWGEPMRKIKVAYKGLVYADAQTKEVMRITMEAVGIPPDFPVKSMGGTLDYAPIEISGETFMLPFHLENHTRDTTVEATNNVDFKMYRKYSADSSIVFGPEEPIPADQLKEQPVTPR